MLFRTLGSRRGSQLVKHFSIFGFSGRLTAAVKKTFLKYTSLPQIWTVTILSVSLPMFLTQTWAGDSDDKYTDEKSLKIQQLIRSGNCKTAWGELWPSVLSGSPRAAGELLGELSWGEMYPPLPMSDADGQIPPETIQFMLDLSFSINVRGLQSSNLADDIQQYRSDSLKYFFSKELFEKYKGAGCLSPNMPNSCTNPVLWHKNINNLKYWDLYFINNINEGVQARCKRPGK